MITVPVSKDCELPLQSLPVNRVTLAFLASFLLSYTDGILLTSMAGLRPEPAPDMNPFGSACLSMLSSESAGFLILSQSSRQNL